jgi:hypothetical protein
VTTIISFLALFALFFLKYKNITIIVIVVTATPIAIPIPIAAPVDNPDCEEELGMDALGMQIPLSYTSDHPGGHDPAVALGGTGDKLYWFRTSHHQYQAMLPALE